MKRKITKEDMERFRVHLHEEEKEKSTIQKYTCDLRKLAAFATDRELTKLLVVRYKKYLKNEKKYRISSINSFLVAANRFFDFMGWHDLKVKSYKKQKESFLPDNKELEKAEYERLVRTALDNGKTRTAMVLQTICMTGIRVSELAAITVQSVKRGEVDIFNKGKERRVALPRDLQVRLLRYVRKNHIAYGCVFRTSKGKPVDRSWIWREMKQLCTDADVCPDKVFPHNLRHLFARTFYRLYKDIARLAEILGHASIETTRIYLRESFTECRKQLDGMGLLVAGV